jgi:hypothetical protein
LPPASAISRATILREIFWRLFAICHQCRIFATREQSTYRLLSLLVIEGQEELSLPFPVASSPPHFTLTLTGLLHGLSPCVFTAQTRNQYFTPGVSLLMTQLLPDGDVALFPTALGRRVSGHLHQERAAVHRAFPAQADGAVQIQRVSTPLFWV